MGGIELGNFEKKMLGILEQKEENIYNKVLEKLNLEERRVNLQERAVRIAEELKGQRVLIEKLLHQLIPYVSGVLSRLTNTSAFLANFIRILVIWTLCYDKIDKTCH